MNMNPNGTPQTSRWFDQVKAFTEAMGQPVGVPQDEFSYVYWYSEAFSLRRQLLREETEEVLLAESWENLTKELADLLYVTIGFAVTFGLPLVEVFERVHQSNMSKLGEDGKPIYREDGKVMKGPNYRPPELGDLFS